MLCKDYGIGTIMSLNLWIECALEPSGSGSVTHDFCSDQHGFVAAHLNVGITNTHAYCRACSHTNPQSLPATNIVNIALSLGYCSCCNNLPWQTDPNFADSTAPYAWI